MAALTTKPRTAGRRWSRWILAAVSVGIALTLFSGLIGGIQNARRAADSATTT